MGLEVLLIDDDVEAARRLAKFLTKEDHHVTTAHDGATGLQSFKEATPDIVLLDYVLPDTDGLTVLATMKELDGAANVVLMTAHGSISTAVEAMRLGASDYLTKPLDLEAVTLKLCKAQELLELRSDLHYLLEKERRGDGPRPFVGRHPLMRDVYEKVRVVANTDNTTVLVTGPSGTGKEVISRTIHSLSARHDRPLMQIDCTAIPLSLMESELFGHERGAFSGADRTKKGLLELADGGTLLLDEIGDMALDLQAKLLRVLQERQFRRVGGTRDLRFDVRVIAATNQDLDRLCQEGRFRRDLLYRLKVFEIRLPGLADRGDDVLDMANVFLSELAARFKKPVRGFTPAAQQALLNYAFPGNVRELKNVIEQAVILAQGDHIEAGLLSIPTVIRAERSPVADDGVGARPDRLPDSSQDPPSIGSPDSEIIEVRESSRDQPLMLEALGPSPLETAERILIKQAMQRSGGNKKRAAALLGISRFSLQRRLDKLALSALSDTDG